MVMTTWVGNDGEIRSWYSLCCFLVAVVLIRLVTLASTLNSTHVHT